nr:hypothetical protein [Microctonus hyperodae filamentous virus]
MMEEHLPPHHREEVATWSPTTRALINDLYSDHYFRHIKQIIPRRALNKFRCLANLTKNRNITWHTIKKNPQFHWNYELLPINPNITFDLIQNSSFLRTHTYSPDINRYISSHVTWDTVINHPEYPWDFYRLSERMPAEIIEQNPQYPWRRSAFEKNPLLPWEFFQKRKSYPWHYNELMGNNPNITVEIIENNLHICWEKNYRFLANNTFDPTKNVNLTWDFYLKYRKRFLWSLEFMARECVTLERLKQYFNYDSYIKIFWAKNPNVTFDMAVSEDKVFEASGNEKITTREIAENLHRYRWDFCALTKNRNIDMAIVAAHPRFMKWYNVKRWQHEIRSPEKCWKLEELLRNPMWGEREKFLKKLHRAATKIQRWWKEIIYNPDSKYVNVILKTHFENMNVTH